ncbi:uncharacterized protein WM294_013567 [Sarcoramphus papa]
MDADGCLGELTPTRLWQLRQRGSETPPSPACPPATAPSAPRPPTRPGHRSREERRGPPPAGYPGPVAPGFARRPPPRPWRRRRVLSPPGQKQRDSLIFIFYFINFHFLHKTSNCKYF